MENGLTLVLDALPGLVWTTLPNGRVDFLSRSWREFTGLGSEELLKKAGTLQVIRKTCLSWSRGGEAVCWLARPMQWKRGFGALTGSTASFSSGFVQCSTRLAGWSNGVD